MLSVSKMIASAEACLGWPYVSPGSNDANGIDCSGLFVKIFRDQNAKIAHGSNTIYRDYCSEKGPITDIKQLKPGMAVFKWKPETPSKFHDNLGDFCHIGLVVSAYPNLKIIHASSVSGCVTTDTKLGKWKYWGKLKNVNYGNSADEKGDEPSPMKYYATVTADSATVKMRAKPSQDCGLYDDVPVGSIVEVLSEDGKWDQVSYGNRQGWYMMSAFLVPINKDESEQNSNDDNQSGDLILVSKALLEKICDQLKKIISDGVQNGVG